MRWLTTRTNEEKKLSGSDEVSAEKEWPGLTGFTVHVLAVYYGWIVLHVLQLYYIFCIVFFSPFQKAINDLRVKHYGRIVQVSESIYHSQFSL